MKKTALYYVLILLTATGCFHDSFEPEPDSDLTDRNALSVTMVRETEPETRALLLDSPGLKMESRWVEGDRLGVYGDKSGENVLYAVTEGNISYGGRTATFITGGQIPQGKLTAYYPYGGNVSVGSDGTIHTKFPATQAFVRPKNVPAPDGSCYVMAGKGTKGEGVEMRNVMSLLKIGYIAPENQVITQVILKDLSGQPLNGSLDIAWDGNIPKGVVSGGTDSITMDCPDGVLATGEDLTVFWMIVPPRDYPKGISVTFILKDGTPVEKTYGKTYGKTFLRNTVYPIGDVYNPVIYGSDQVKWEYKNPDGNIIVDGAKTDLIKDMRLYKTYWQSRSGNGSVYLPTLSITVHKDFGGKVGDYVFFNEPSEILPDGFIGQIMEYESYGQEASVIIKSVEDMSEPFSKLEIGTPIYAPDGSVIEGGGLELDLASRLERVETPDGQELPFDVEGDTLTLYEPPTRAVTTSSYTSPRLRLKAIQEKINDNCSGEMSAGVQLKLTTKFSMGSDGDGNTEYLHFNVNPKILLTFNVKFSATMEFESLKGDIDFGTFYFAPIMAGPIMLRPQVQIGAYCGASASAELNVSYKYVSNLGNYGFSYIRSQGFAVRHSIAQPEDEDGFNVPEASLSGNVGFSIGLYATPGINLYGMITANLQTKFGLNFSVGYEAKVDGDGFSRGLYFQIAPEFSLTPSVTTLGGVWTKTWEEWQPLDFDPIWQKYIIPEMKVDYFKPVDDRDDRKIRLDFRVDESHVQSFDFVRLKGYTGVKYDFTLKKETLFDVGVGVAVYTGRSFGYDAHSYAKLWCQYGLEDYAGFGLAYMPDRFYQGATLIELYSGPDDNEDSKRYEGTIDIPFENGVYYEIYPCVFLPSRPKAPLFHYDQNYPERFVCHYPYLSNGEPWPIELESWYDEEAKVWRKTVE